ncbi:MAG: hypothetical protein K2X03_17550 [Bryobacteraceae bacterium]|nr:hypothetical protein [Bryobacteraceae bacterium]
MPIFLRMTMRMWAILALASLPSAWLAWSYRDLPRIGELHDDGIYLISAKSLTDGQGYRILSLPGEPAQTKYPPLYPLYLSALWRLGPGFPAMLPWAMLMQWIFVPLLLGLSALYYARHSLRPELAALLGFNAYVLAFGTSLFTEIPFTTLLLACLLLGERRWALTAGLVAGAAYLTRTAALPLAVAFPLYYWLAGQRREAGRFLLGMLPAVIGWTAWTSAHRSPSLDLIQIESTNYIAYQLMNVTWETLPVVFWKNLDQLLLGVGAFALPKTGMGFFLKILTMVAALFTVAGIVRLFRLGRMRPYIAYAALSSAILLVWHFPPNERFTLPLLPLCLAGLWVETGNLYTMIRQVMAKPARDQKVAGALLAVAALLAIGLSLWRHVEADFSVIPAGYAQGRQDLAEKLAAYRWMDQHLPPGERVMAYDDPTLYLFTGRYSIHRVIPTKYWYGEDSAATVKCFRDIDRFAGERGFRYLYVNQSDFRRDLAEEDKTAVMNALRRHPALQPVYRSARGVIYEVAEARRLAQTQ